MTRILILSGTGWLGSRIAQRWVDRGAEVTSLARGHRHGADGVELVVADRDAPDAYRAVQERDWDEVIDVSSDPVQVGAAADALAGRAAHATYVSSVSVYAGADEEDADETAELVPAWTDGDEDDYAGAKVAAERAVTGYAARVAIVRPGLIVGPGDPTERFGYWPARFAAAADGPVLVPQTAGRVQVIDVDDLADFIVTGGARAFDGIVNAVGESHPIAEFLTLLRDLAGHTGDLREAPADWLGRHGVAHWMGPRSLPLWLPDDMPGFATRSNAAYRAAGGRIRPLAETAARVLADERTRGVARTRGSGLERSEELDLLRMWEAERPTGV
ncbi:NAD-dependent epimerase/dehydratase family protein [Microbacterium sp. EYE_5]|uniref:NAD-dependent epimerase/dehydratase family protein n=1 Tax=unclassified Microbacterium TaxID=2609290 RepID=UPI002005A231|nr:MULTISPECIES: NAD-dependent epimerase/dehydratase family protein [unclassified Microbacterium]MCK6081892.1 NAD-dependent epimerase/dehydratase family protein [Microbacterium sp. EYE_382]MCK6087162.1 NAD-dependent epimerase/dehydratase family protein [Microbacterium sp. EYE_384]MCK6124860.1 NAD-dependent epimerase/dehydratase family protein [Microbacterium sp. EYE_80]MCK6127925.1 NAD-dependent epimerase/dehydratase family protein [Microbacterium sp. EYE_79]MCK6142846.1 NAD-dependent epimeras